MCVTTWSPGPLPATLFLCEGSGMWRQHCRERCRDLRPLVCCVRFSEHLRPTGKWAEGTARGLSCFHTHWSNESHQTQAPSRPSRPILAAMLPVGVGRGGGWRHFPRMPFMWTQSCPVLSSPVSQDLGRFPEVQLANMWPAVAVALRCAGPRAWQGHKGPEDRANLLSG